MFQKNVVGWFEIYVEDMERARKFYESVFELNLEPLLNPATESNSLEMWSFPGDSNTYGSPGALVKYEGYPVGKNSVIIYFTCKDCAIEEKKVSKFGGKVFREKMAIGDYGFISLVHDSEGNMIGLHTPTM